MHVWIDSPRTVQVLHLHTHAGSESSTHAHAHIGTLTWSITQSDKQDQSPMDFLSDDFCKQISRQCDWFPLSWLYNKLRNNFMYVLILYFLVDALVGALNLLSVMGVDSTWLWLQRLQSSWEPVLINAEKKTLSPHPELPISCVSSPAWEPSTTQGLSLRHHHSSLPTSSSSD